MRKIVLNPHFTDEETEIETSYLICSKFYGMNSASQTLMHLGINLSMSESTSRMQILIKKIRSGA